MGGGGAFWKESEITYWIIDKSYIYHWIVSCVDSRNKTLSGRSHGGVAFFINIIIKVYVTTMTLSSFCLCAMGYHFNTCMTIYIEIVDIIVLFGICDVNHIYIYFSIHFILICSSEMRYYNNAYCSLCYIYQNFHLSLILSCLHLELSVFRCVLRCVFRHKRYIK